MNVAGQRKLVHEEESRNHGKNTLAPDAVFCELLLQSVRVCNV
jgi:hypothetical protein